MSAMRLLVCGDREWEDGEAIGAALDALRPDVVIEGEARGADRLARIEADYRGIRVLQFPADWTRYGRAAGVIRNQEMMDKGRPTHVLAYHPRLATSKGTADMVGRARKAGLPVCVVADPALQIMFHTEGFFNLAPQEEDA